MKIRDRLSLQFAILSAVLLFLVLAAIYGLFWNNRLQDFYTHLLDRAITNAELFLAQDNLSAEKFREVQRKYPQTLPDEIVHIYNDKDQSVFILSLIHISTSPNPNASTSAATSTSLHEISAYPTPDPITVFRKGTPASATTISSSRLKSRRSEPSRCTIPAMSLSLIHI